MTGGAGPGTNALVTIAVILLVVARFLYRELRERTVRLSSLWIRPGIFAAVTLFVIAGSFIVPGLNHPLVFMSIAAGIGFGMATGQLVLDSTSFTPSDRPREVRVKGSIGTVIVWLAAIALRMAARLVVGGSGGAAAQFELNIGLIALISTAFVVVAIGFHRAIDRFSETPAAPQKHSLVAAGATGDPANADTS